MSKLEPSKNPFDWWIERHVSFPLLHEMAARFLCLQVTSTSSERLFSKAGLTLSDEEEHE